MVIPLGTNGARQNLISAAAELVHESSYRAVSVNPICKKANVNKGSFYYFFESKQALMLTALDQMWGTLEATGIAECFDAARPPGERVLAMFDKAYEMHSATKEATGHVVGCLFGNLAAEASTLDDGLGRQVAKVFDEWAGYFERAVIDAQSDGDIDPSRDPKETSRQLLAALQGSFLMAKVTNDTRPIREAKDAVAAQLWPNQVAGAGTR